MTVLFAPQTTPAAPAAALTPFEETCAALAASTKPDGERLHELFQTVWDYRMREYPEAATYDGYPGHNDRWMDLSLGVIERRKRELHAPLKTLETIRCGNLNAADCLSYDLFRRNFEKAAEGTRFPSEYLQIDQLSGIQQSVANVIRAAPKFTVKDFEDIVARLNAVGVLVEQTIVLLEKGLAAGITPPRVTLRNVVRQVDDQLVADPKDSPILDSLKHTPPTLSVEELRRLRAAAAEAVRTNVLPAYRRLRVFLAEKYIPQARETISMKDLPDGDPWYDFRVRVNTTTQLTPREIHEIGLKEVDRIDAEMEGAMKESGFQGSRAEFLQFLRTDSRFYYQTGEDLLIGYRDICKRVDPELLRLFGTLPRQPYGVAAIPKYTEKSQPAAYYEAGSTKGGRPGTFYANTYDLKSQAKWEMEALVLHEAVPGHHLQIALADEMEGVPEFRKHGSYTAYVEGWGLYAESLGYEMGFYRDAYAKFGQLAFEMWRAVRLVVDTGIHAMGWSRQRAIDYFLKTAGRTEHDVAVEVDRYIVWPGQALAYKIGQLKIRELRESAAKELGDKFDLRAFHDEVLRHGALPLDVLEARIRDWVDGRRDDGPLGPANLAADGRRD